LLDDFAAEAAQQAEDEQLDHQRVGGTAPVIERRMIR
jgi:hypothetical protein